MNAHRPGPNSADERELPAKDYLWTGEPPVDREIVQIERALASLRYRAATPRTSAAAPAVQRGAGSRSWSFAQLRAAALLAITIAGLWAINVFTDSFRDIGTVKQMAHDRASNGSAGWNVTTVRGSPRIGRAAVKGEGVLQEGQWLETDRVSQAEVAVADIGRVMLKPDSRLRLVRTHQLEHRLELAAGEIEAMIIAPPRLFIVDTPAATAIDLGCAYVLNVDESGRGALAVTMGWVALQRDGRSAQGIAGAGDGAESIVPRDAMCFIRANVGPGTPFYSDASAALKRALERLDFADVDDSSAMPDAVSIILAEARERDSLTLWHLLFRAPERERGRIFDRLAAFAPAPSDVTRTAIVAGDEAALRRWRDTFMWSPDPPISPMRD